MANNETTTKFKVDISELKKAMQTARREVALANSEFKAASSGMDNWSKSTDGISAKLKQLNSNLSSQKRVLAEYEKTLAEVKTQYGENSKEAMDYQTKVNTQKSVVNQTEKQIKTYTQSLEKAEEAERIAAETGRDATEVFDELGQSAEDAGNSAENSTGGYTVMKNVLANLVTDGIRLAIDALKEFATEAINTGISFEAAMSEVAAISGTTGEDLKLLEETAKKYGSTTVFSASEAAQALKYMALAGWDAQTASSALGGVLDLAAASGMDLAEASDMVTDYMSAFGMEAKNSTYFADMLAYAQSKSNTSVSQLGEAFKNTAANMNAAGQDVETTTALLAMMANQGFKGSEAGTALTAMMRDLTAKMKDGKIMIGETAVAVSDANGNYRDMTDILKEVEAATQGMGETERATALATTFTADSTKGLNLLLNAGVSEAEKFELALRNAGGTADDMGDIMNDNAQGDIKSLESALEGVKLEVYKELQPHIREFIQYLTKDGTKTLSDIGKSLTDLAKRAMPYVKKGIEALGKVVKFVAEHFETLVTIIWGGVTAFKAIKAAMAIANMVTAFRNAVTASTVAVGLATKAQYAWNAAMAANVIGAVITAVMLLVTWLVGLSGAEEDAAEQTDLLSESQRETVTAAQEAADAYRDTTKAASELAAAESANIDYTKSLWGELQSLVGANGEVKAGYEARAGFILGQLNEALGTEYTMNGNIIDQYETIQEEIGKVIEAKQAQVLLEAYEDSYREAVEKVAGAEKARATQAQEIAAQRKVAAQAEREAQEARAEFNAKVEDGIAEKDMMAMQRMAERVDELETAAAKEKGILSDKQAEYNETTAAVQGYYDDISNYETASTLVLEGASKDAIGFLNNIGGGFKTATSTARLSAKEQKKVLEQQVIDTEVNLKLMEADYKEKSKSMTDAEKTQAQARLANARQQADDAKVEFQKVGGNITKGMAEGSTAEEWTLTSSMTRLINRAVQAAKDAAGIKSPSRLFKKSVGKFIGLGVAAGIDESTKDVVKSVKGQITDIKNAYGTAAGQLNGSISGGLGGGGVVNNFTQINNSPKALSRLEIYRQSKNLLGYAGGV